MAAKTTFHERFPDNRYRKWEKCRDCDLMVYTFREDDEVPLCPEHYHLERWGDDNRLMNLQDDPLAGEQMKLILRD